MLENSPATSYSISPQQAARELLRRDDAASHLIPFTEFTLPRYNAGDHHKLIAEKLEAVERGDIDRLMIFAPPRHGKSELASKRFPAWFLGRNPAKEIIAASYNSDLARDFGRSVRNIARDPDFAAIFPGTTLADDSKAADRWNTGQGGGYVAAGVGTAITGRGAHVLLIDDPVKDHEEADSELRRQRVWDWYTSTAYTRLMPGGAIVVIMTRWHEDDLAGRLLDAQAKGGDQWEVIELQAINDAGEALWPASYGLPELERIKGTIGPRDWTALYQQRPAPDEGAFFKRDWIKTYESLPPDVHYYGASDYAVTADGGDWTVHIVGAVDSGGNLYIEDIWRGQTTADVWIDAFLGLVGQYSPLTWAEEQGQIIKSVGPFIDRRMDETRTYCSREQFTSIADKPTRARAIQARMATGKVLFRDNASWLAGLMSELLTFPAGKHDDQVDALSLLGRLMAEMVGKGIGLPSAPRDRWDKAFDDDEGAESWRVL